MYRPVKRFLDIIAALVGLLFMVPVYVIVAWLIRRESYGPVLFQQARPGRHGRIFHLYKFRSMRESCDAQGNPLPDAERITRIGSFLRRTSLDELPSFWNVLKGDMSMVGPRPLLPRYLPYYRERERLRHSVRPGITGLAQVNGRNLLSWDRRLALDVWYVENMSLLLDLRILLKTVVRVLRRDSVIVDPRSVLRDLDEERGPLAGQKP